MQDKQEGNTGKIPLLSATGYAPAVESDPAVLCPPAAVGLIDDKQNDSVPDMDLIQERTGETADRY
jgi:hypothetical protein